jgi:hypothetical protein
MKNYLLAMGGTELGWSRHNEEGIFRDYEAEVDRLFESAKPWGLECIRFNNDFIFNLPYYKDHLDILEEVSFGFAFRAICFYETMKNLEVGDVALFVDSNHIIQNDPSIFYNIARQNIFFVHDHIWVYYPQKDWTHRDMFVNMGCDEERFWNAPQIQGNIFGVMKSEVGERLVKEWFEFSLRPEVMFGEGKHPNFPSFKTHRYDQSIMSMLVEKYHIPYVNRTSNVWMEYVIPELDGIMSKNPVDNSFRKERDGKHNQ